MLLLITPLFSSHGPVPLTQSRGSGQETTEVAKCHPGCFQASPTALQFPRPAGERLEPVQTPCLEGVHSNQWGTQNCFLSCALEKSLRTFSLLPFGPSFLQAQGAIWRGQGHILVSGNLHRRRCPERWPLLRLGISAAGFLTASNPMLKEKCSTRKSCLEAELWELSGSARLACGHCRLLQVVKVDGKESKTRKHVSYSRRGWEGI